MDEWVWGAFLGLFVDIDIWRLILYDDKMVEIRCNFYEKDWMGSSRRITKMGRSSGRINFRFVGI